MKATNFSSNFKRIIKEKHIDKNELAYEFYVTKETIQNYERGRSYPPLKRLDELCKLLNVNLVELFK